MYKGKSRFQQAMTFKGRRLSGYPKSRKLASGQNSTSDQRQFEIRTAYIKKISPLIRQFIRDGLTDANIAAQLRQRGIDTPSGAVWTEKLVAELVHTIKLSGSQYADRGRDRKSK